MFFVSPKDGEIFLPYQIGTFERPIVFGHSMGGLNTMHAAHVRPDFARALVLVDVGPELSGTGRKVVRDFVVHNIEFDNVDIFLDNVVRYEGHWVVRHRVARALWTR